MEISVILRSGRLDLIVQFINLSSISKKRYFLTEERSIMTLRLIPYLVMNGNAKEAIQFYEKALDAQVLFNQTFGEMPENPEFPLPAEAKDRVSHATIKVGETELMFSDTFPGQPHQSGNQVTICISTDDAEKAKQIYNALSDGGQ